jgi:hypothetical protein
MKKGNSDWTEEAWTDFNSGPGTGLDRGSVDRLQLRSGHQGQQERQKLNGCQGGMKRTNRSKVPAKQTGPKLEKGPEDDET